MGVDQIFPLSPTGSATLSAVDEHGSFDDDVLEEGASSVPPISSRPNHNTNNRNPSLSIDTTCKSTKAPRTLSTVSDQYDRDHKGWLDPTERKMRELDKTGKGYLDNDTVYSMMKSSMNIQRKMVTQRWLMLGLGAFALVLAVANMGTAVVAARLAKETEVTAAGDLASKYSHKRVGTTARSESFDLGTTQHIAEGANRRLGLLKGFARHELGSFNALASARAKALWNSFDVDGSAVQIRWTCGVGGGGSTFAVPVISVECTPYSFNMSNSTDTGGDGVSGDEVSGLYYEYHVRKNWLSKTLKIDCVDGASECVVTGTECCGDNADCGEREKCSLCGCQCVDVDAIVPMCMSSPPCGGGFDAW